MKPTSTFKETAEALITLEILPVQELLKKKNTRAVSILNCSRTPQARYHILQLLVHREDSSSEIIEQ